MQAFFTGLITGFLIVIPIGPINVSVISTGMVRDRLSAFAIGFGGSVMDFTYFFIILHGLLLFHPGEATVLIIKLGGVCFLLAVGALIMKASPPKTDLQRPKPVGRSSLPEFFLLGVFLYVSNPTLIVTLTAILAAIASWSLLPETSIGRLLFCTGAGIGSALWYWLLVILTDRLREKLAGRALILINRACGLLIVLLALYMGISLVMDILGSS